MMRLNLKFFVLSIYINALAGKKPCVDVCRKEIDDFFASASWRFQRL